MGATNLKREMAAREVDHRQLQALAAGQVSLVERALAYQRIHLELKLYSHIAQAEAQAQQHAQVICALVLQEVQMVVMEAAIQGTTLVRAQAVKKAEVLAGQELRQKVMMQLSSALALAVAEYTTPETQSNMVLAETATRAWCIYCRKHKEGLK